MTTLKRRNPEMKEEAHHLMVFRVLFQTGVLILHWPSPNWTHWRDGPTCQEGPQDKVRLWGQSPGKNLPQRIEEETDHFLRFPGREHQKRRPGDLGGTEAS